MIKNKKTVVVGMSGGVDSSVAALLLKQQGYRVIGLFMKNWEDKDENGICHATQDFDDVRQVCDRLDIPYYSINFVEEYRNEVFKHFISDLKKGLTPNPDILCNREIKFKVFLEKAIELGADYLATGHYCQIQEKNNLLYLKKGEDPNKDQTYFLYTINHSILQKVLFPIGCLQKSEVRQLAKDFQLVTADKKDSTGICFIGDRHFRTFVSQYIAFHPGCFETLEGKKVGNHFGAAYYTIGQRKGLGIGGAGDAWFVVDKDMKKNVVFVEQGAEHPALFCDELIANQLSWVGEVPGEFPFVCSAKTRYRQMDQPCVIESIENGCAIVKFLQPQRAITLGQSVVFYLNDLCLGGGVIEKRGPTHYEKMQTDLSIKTC